MTAREVEKHRKKSLEHLRSLEKIEVELQKAQMGRTSKAMPALPKAEDKPAEKMGVCGSTAKCGPHLPHTSFELYCSKSDLLRPLPAVPPAAPPLVKAKPKLRTVAWRFLHGNYK